MPLPTDSLIDMGGMKVSDDDCYETYDATSSSTAKSSAVRMLRCNWADRFKLATFLLGGSYLISGTPFTSTGQSYPDNPSFVCQRVEPNGTYGGGVRSRGASGQVAYEWANLKATYLIPQYDFGSANQIGTQELDFSSNAISTSDGINSYFKWSSGPDNNKPLPPAACPALRQTTCQFNIVRYNVPKINFTLVMSLLNSVNSSAFYGAAPGQVLFLGGRSSRKISAAGAWNWDISYSVNVKPTGRQWNELFGPHGWQTFTDNSGSPFFPSNDLNQLLA